MLERGELHLLVDRVFDSIADEGSTRAIDGSAAVTRIVGWAQGAQAILAGKVAESGPALRLVSEAGVHSGQVDRLLERAEIIGRQPRLARAQEQGLPVEFLDAVTQIRRRVEPVGREGFDLAVDRASRLATSMSLTKWKNTLATFAERASTQSATDLLDRQRRACRASMRTDHATGMGRIEMTLDPERFVRVAQRVDAAMAGLFAESTPPEAPSDPLEKNNFLRALALYELLMGEGGSITAPEITVIIDTRTPQQPDIDWGLPVSLPAEKLVELWPRADISTVITVGGVVVHADGNMNLGRKARTASRAQRRALLAIHRGCAVPGCHARGRHLKAHHIRYWESGGETNLDNLIPLCPHHHGRLHAENWHLELTENRTIVIDTGHGPPLINPPPGVRAP